MQVESKSKPTFTVDEANDDTISAFEETDAAVDLRIKNSVSRHRLRGKWVITLRMNTLTAMLSSSQQHLKTCLIRIKRQ